MRLFNTALQRLEELEAGEVVDIYTCGITPYDSTHIGHAAIFLTFDILQRRLRSLGHQTRLVRNVTDIDDDLLTKADQLGIDYQDLVASEVAKLRADLASLNVLPSWSEPMATAAVPEIIEIAGGLLSDGYAYEVEGTVFFDVTTWDEFGSFSGYSEQQMLTFAAERGGFPDDARKRNPLDFILWQAAAPGEPTWDSPWGPGRPGWHIECSALIKKEFGDTIDIHGGGSDLIFPHHECELAQSTAAFSKPFVKIWMHQAMVQMDGEKMSKSLGNMDFVSDLVKEFDPRAIRIAITQHHYRNSWEWHRDLPNGAILRLASWEGSIGGSLDESLREKVGLALDDDLNTPKVFALIDEAAASGIDVSDAAELIGIPLN